MVSVLLVDDHTVVRDGLRALLEAHPEITVVGDVADGTHAVGYVKELHPDVVVMDIALPDLSGIDATRQMLEMDPEVRILILSMLGTSEYVYRALQVGVRGYMLKESAGREVVAAVLSIAENRRYFSEPIINSIVEDFLHHREISPEKAPLEKLSQREFEIMHLVLGGKSSTEIGTLLSLSPKTVDTYRSRLMHKLGVSDLAGLIKFAIQQGLIQIN